MEVNQKTVTSQFQPSIVKMRNYQHGFQINVY